MSEHSASAPHDIEACAAQWIRHKEFGDWNEDAEREFEAWLAQSVLHRVAFLRLDEGWKRTERLAALRQPNSPGAPERVWPSRTTLSRVALALAIVGVLGIAARSYLLGASEDIYTTPVGGREILTLVDGSHVELNTNTVLRIGKYQRYAVLEKGEAYFQIKHDVTHPFVVTAGGHRITDLGTQFAVNADAGKLEVSLLEGRARIDSTDASSPVRTAVLIPGDVAVATADTLSVRREPVQTLTNTVGWRHGVVIFRHMALADAAAEFNRYNLKKLVVDPRIAGVTIDGTFATDNLETFARVARIALGLHVESLDKEIVISR